MEDILLTFKPLVPIKFREIRDKWSFEKAFFKKTKLILNYVFYHCFLHFLSILALDKQYITLLNIYFYLNEWRHYIQCNLNIQISFYICYSSSNISVDPFFNPGQYNWCENKKPLTPRITGDRNGALMYLSDQFI